MNALHLQPAVPVKSCLRSPQIALLHSIASATRVSLIFGARVSFVKICLLGQWRGRCSNQSETTFVLCEHGSDRGLCMCQQVGVMLRT